MGGKPRAGAQQWVLGTHTLKNRKLVGEAGAVFPPGPTRYVSLSAAE